MHTIPRARVEEEGGDIEEEIDRFTSTLETSAQPSSLAPTWGLDRLDRLLAKVDQLYTLLESHVQHTVNQFAYVQGQITVLSFQIDDLSVDQGSDLESDKF